VILSSQLLKVDKRKATRFRGPVALELEGPTTSAGSWRKTFPLFPSSGMVSGRAIPDSVGLAFGCLGGFLRGNLILAVIFLPTAGPLVVVGPQRSVEPGAELSGANTGIEP